MTMTTRIERISPKMEKIYMQGCSFTAYVTHACVYDGF